MEATETVDVGALDTETTALATDPLGTQRLGGAPADTFVSVRVRFPVYAEPSVTGQVKIDNVLSGHAVLIKKIQIVPNPKPFDFFPSSNIL